MSLRRDDPILKPLKSLVESIGLQRKKNSDDLAAIAVKERDLQREKALASEKLASVEGERRRLSTLLAPLGEDADEQIVWRVSAALRYCDKVGGLDEMRRQVEASSTLKTRKKTFQRNERNKEYRQFLKDKGIVPNSIYAMEWTNLVDRSDNLTLPPAVSFVFVLPDCETHEDNNDSDPYKIHVRLALCAHDAVNEVYVDVDSSRMRLVEFSNVTEICDEVFSFLNVGILYSADGPGPEGVTVEAYTKKLKEDSCRLILTHVKDVYDKVSKYTSNTSRTGLAQVGEKRARE